MAFSLSAGPQSGSLLSVSSISSTLFGVNAGDLIIIAFAGVRFSTPAPSIVSVTVAGEVNPTVYNFHTIGFQRQWITAVLVATSSGNKLVTVTLDLTCSSILLRMMAVTPDALPVSFDGDAFASGSGTAGTVNVTTLQDEAFIFGFPFAAATAVFTPGANYTEISPSDPPFDSVFQTRKGLYDLDAGVAGVKAVDFTQSGASIWQIGATSFSHPPPAVPEGTAEFDLNLSMVPQAEQVEFDLILNMLEYGTATMPLELLMYDPSFVNSNPLCWSVRVTLDGADVSDTLIGSVRVEAEESLARTAVFTLKHTGSVSVPSWVGKPVTIDFQQIDANNNPLVSVRVFTGVVDVPNFDPTRVLVQFDCIDNLNGVVGQNPREALDQLIDGYWSPFVFDADANSLEYAQAQLLSVPRALDMDAYAQLRVTDWAATVTPHFILDATTHVLDDSVSFEMPNRSEIKNCVNIEFQYRFPRLRARQTGVGWGMPSLFSLFTTMTNFTIPTKQMTEGAIQGLGNGGWFVTGISYYEPPVSQFIGPEAWVCSPGVAAALAWFVTVGLARKWSQIVTEIYPMKVKADSSITGVGEICEDETVGMEVDAGVFDFAGWEADRTRQPAPSFLGLVHGGAPPWPRAGAGDSFGLDMTSYGQDFFFDMVDVPGFARADMDNAVQTVLNVAKTRILGSHRHSRIVCVAPLNPFIDLIHTVEIDTPKLAGKGKVAAITYEMDIDSGKAVMTVSVAISGTGFVGFQPETPLAAPPLPPPPTYTPLIAQSGQTFFGSDVASTFPQPSVALCSNGYLGNRADQGLGFDGDKRYVEEFRLQAPAIEDELTQPLDLEQALVEFDVSIPQDPLTLTG